MDMKTYLRLISCLLALVVTSFSVMAQEDVTATYLTNYGFDSNFNYKSGATNEVKQELKTVNGWTSEVTVDYTIMGVYEYGFAGKFNGGTMPASGYNGSKGGGLVLSTGWGVSFTLCKTVTLPAGIYTVNVPTYNGRSSTKGTSALSWIPEGGTAVVSDLDSYPASKWTMDQITFTLTKETKGKLRIGYKAADGGSSNSAIPILDYVQILYVDIKADLIATITEASALYGNGEGIDADLLKAAIDEAQGVNDKADASMEEISNANDMLKETIYAYRLANASEKAPIDFTELIYNPSFEIEGTKGWTASGMSKQTNEVFSQKDGSAYLEAWTSAGNKIKDVSIKQSISGLRKGNYQLSAKALHIQQTGSGSTVNKGAPQTGGFIYAGSSRTAVTNMGTYKVKFSVVEDNGSVEIGAMTENPTGNYFCIDDFKLNYIGRASSSDYAAELQALVDKCNAYLENGFQQSAKDLLASAISDATAALEDKTTDAEGNTVYNDEKITEAYVALLNAFETAEASYAIYLEIADRIAYAKDVYGWWKDDARKEKIVADLKVAIESTEQVIKDYTLTEEQLDSARTELVTKIKTVDKKIYCSGSACGTNAQLLKPDSHWSYERSKQSKHWVIFWEKGYGTETPSSVADILKKADECFELYANKLAFIKAGQGASKTDTYKMIIRLEYSDAWKAEGSGIDNQIGLLTLSRWASTSRGGQTLAHEIGHTFQYQVHCDNGDWRGWMFNWGKSTQNPFWEMCAQWMAYVYMPQQLFDNEWFHKSINNLHRHPLAGYLRYENFFIQNLFVHKHGWDAVGRLWNECDYGEDPFQTYMRTRMTGTEAQKLNQLGDEMWEWGARMTTFDFDAIRDRGESRILYRKQTAMIEDEEGYLWPDTSICIENWGNNAIRLNAPNTTKTIYVEFEGMAGSEGGYNNYRVDNAGWKIGFVSYKQNGTRTYSEITTVTGKDSKKLISFECPPSTYLWLVVSGAPTAYWNRDMINWLETTAEQWPYRVKFYKTNIYGKATDNTDPTGIEDVVSENSYKAATVNNVYSLTGQIVRKGTTSLEGLPEGIYIVNGKKVLKK